MAPKLQQSMLTSEGSQTPWFRLFVSLQGTLKTMYDIQRRFEINTCDSAVKDGILLCMILLSRVPTVSTRRTFWNLTAAHNRGRTSFSYHSTSYPCTSSPVSWLPLYLTTLPMYTKSLPISRWSTEKKFANSRTLGLRLM